MTLALVAEAIGVVGVTGLLGWAGYRPRQPLVWHELRFPDELTADQVAGLLRHVAGVRQGPVQFLVRAAAGEVCFFVAAAARVSDSLRSAASGLMPEVRMEPVDDVPLAAGNGTATRLGLRVGWLGPWPLLRTEAPELSVAGLLGALAHVEHDEQLELLVRLWPAGRVHRPIAPSERGSSPPNPWFMRLWWPAQPPREDLRVIRTKYSDLLLATEVIVVATARGRERATQLTQRVVAALRTNAGVRGVIRSTVIPSRKLPEALSRQRGLLRWERRTLLSPDEAVLVVGLPVEAPAIPGIGYGVGPLLLASHAVPRSGRIFARSTWPGQTDRPLAQPVIGALQHCAIVGGTGMGKSTLVAGLALQDMAAGRGALIVDLKGDLVADLLERIPEKRRKDVIVVEPALGGRQPGLQLFPTGSDAELTSDLILGTLQELWRDSWGIRSSQYLGLGLRTLAAMPGATLVELPWLFSDPQFRARALKGRSDPWLQSAWRRFAALSAAEQAVQLSSPLTKLEQLTGRARLRLVLGQTDSKLHFPEALARKQIVLVSLPPGLLGVPATRLLAALTLWQFFQAVEGRAALPPEQRTPFMTYIDEVAVLSSLPLPLDGLLERARGLGVGLTLSPQALSQLSQPVRASLLANAGSLVAFRQSSDDEAKVLARALPGVTAKQLQHLGQFEIAMRLSLAPGLVTGTMTGRTAPPEAISSDATALRQASAQRFGQTLEEVDAALKRRHGLDDAAAPNQQSLLGETRRRP